MSLWLCHMSLHPTMTWNVKNILLMLCNADDCSQLSPVFCTKTDVDIKPVYTTEMYLHTAVATALFWSYWYLIPPSIPHLQSIHSLCTVHLFMCVCVCVCVCVCLKCNNLWIASPYCNFIFSSLFILTTLNLSVNFMCSMLGLFIT